MLSFPWPTLKAPTYRPGKVGLWSCEPTPKMGAVVGYWRPVANVKAGWMFCRNGVIWMSLTPMETESQMPHVAAAHGHVVIAGLGMGVTLYNILRKPEVKRVTVIEIDPDVPKLLNRCSAWQSWAGRHKLELVIGDAIEYRPLTSPDFLYVDTWSRLGDDEAVPITKAIQANVKAGAVGWWGQEFDLLDHARKADVPVDRIDAAFYWKFARDVGLPLIEINNPIYPALAVQAVTLQCFAPRQKKVGT